MSSSLWPHGLLHARLPCPSPTPGAYSSSCPSSWWCHPTISSSVVPFSSCLQSFPASESFPMSQFFTSGGQSVGVSALASVLPMNIQDWFPLGWTGWIPLQSKGLFKSLLQHHSSKASILRCSAFFIVQLSHPYMTTGKTIALTTQTFVGKVISLLFNTWSRFVTAFLPRSKHLLISWLQSLSAVILEPKKIKSVTVPELMWSWDITTGIIAITIIAPGTVIKLFTHDLMYCSTVRELRHREGKFTRPESPGTGSPAWIYPTSEPAHLPASLQLLGL